ncbi:hypothetical protein PRIPAC_89778, partial [Pristionchus pacificus]
KKMKLALLLSVLVPAYLCNISVKVNVHGNLTCSKPFNYIVTLWEEDQFANDFVGEDSGKESKKRAAFEVRGEAEDSWFESYVELLMTIEHSCGQEHACVCKKFDPANDDVDVSLNINLSKTKLKKCDACKESKKRRESMVVKFNEPK